MSEEPENHTLHPLREMREENAAFRAEMNARFETMQAENLRLRAETRTQLASVLETAAGIAKGVKTVHKAATASQEDVSGQRAGQKIVEAELRALRGRVERLEDGRERGRSKPLIARWRRRDAIRRDLVRGASGTSPAHRHRAALSPAA